MNTFSFLKHECDNDLLNFNFTLNFIFLKGKFVLQPGKAWDIQTQAQELREQKNHDEIHEEITWQQETSSAYSSQEGNQSSAGSSWAFNSLATDVKMLKCLSRTFDIMFSVLYGLKAYHLDF